MPPIAYVFIVSLLLLLIGWIWMLIVAAISDDERTWLVAIFLAAPYFVPRYALRNLKARWIPATVYLVGLVTFFGALIKVG
ncbi:MAG: hypothetical protein KDK33_18355 [Leptospiraceae bacterium]|nr:hypothetical protein [Leptospiraceae bacterium]